MLLKKDTRFINQKLMKAYIFFNINIQELLWGHKNTESDQWRVVPGNVH